MRWKIFIALLLMMLLYSGCRKVTGEIEIKPDKIEFPASGGRAVIKITRDCREMPKKVFNFPNELIDKVIEIS